MALCALLTPSRCSRGANRRDVGKLHAELKRLATALAGPHCAAAADISGVPLPSPLSRLHLRGMTERTRYGRGLAGRSIRGLNVWGLGAWRLSSWGLKILGWRRGRRRRCGKQRLPAGAAKGGRLVYRCSTVRAEGRRRLIHESLLSASWLASWLTRFKMLPKSSAKSWKAAANEAGRPDSSYIDASTPENVERCAFSGSRAKLYPAAGSFTPIRILSILRT
jgi:hypothetical protein